MRCHYEVIGVHFEANDDEIKKAYRKIALKCHPDKNIGREGEAAEEFKEVQGAYATLSDPQERAFYDRNRENILRGGDGKTSGNSVVPDVFKYFSSSCYPGGFSDSKDGFYATYKKFFFDLYKKDCDITNSDNGVPQFGNSTTSHEDVADFYGYWTSYCTSMSFAWCDKIDVRDAQNRWMEKQINKENKKVRDEERKKFNDSVRQLAFYCRRRDPRWKRRVEEFERKKEEAAQKFEKEKAKNAQKRREQLKEDLEDEVLKKQREEYFEKLKEMEADLDGIPKRSGNSSSESSNNSPNNSDDEYEFDGFTCEICIKIFNTEYALETHLKTKKHAHNVQKILKEHNLEEVSDAGEKEIDEDVDDEEYSEEESYKELKRKQKKKNKKLKKQNMVHETVQKVNNDDNSERSPKLDDNKTEELSDLTNNININENEEVQEQEPKVKLKGKKAKNARKKAKQEKEDEEIATGSAETELIIEQVCQTCNSKFSSKNKLFRHLKSTGHAAIKDDTSNKKSKKRK